MSAEVTLYTIADRIGNACLDLDLLRDRLTDQGVVEDEGSLEGMFEPALDQLESALQQLTDLTNQVEDQPWQD